MAINNLNNLNENMALLKEKFSSMYAEIANIKNLYADMRQEAEDSYIESQRHWNKRAYEEQSRVFSQAGEKIAQVDKMINGLDNLEKQLCIVDKSYAKRRDNQAFAVDLELDIADSDIFNKFKSLHDEAVAIAKDCSLTVKVQPIQELGMLISNKRKLKYERLFSLLAQTKLMRGKLLEQLNRENDGIVHNWEEKKKEEIDQAALETAELIQLINDRENSEIEKVLNDVNSNLDANISASDVELLMQIASLLGGENILPGECCEHIYIGSLKIDLTDIMQYREAFQYVRERYSEQISGTELSLPAIYELATGFNVCFDAHGNSESAKRAIHSIMFSLLKNQPASRQIFFLSDPEGRSRGFNIYLDFLKKHQDIFGGKICTTKEMIREALNYLSEFVDQVGQGKFIGYSDIFEYNVDVTDKQEALKCLCLLNFPKYFDDYMLDLLYNIVRNGKSYGVQVLIEFDEREISGRTSEASL